jgi:hypothetical protein
VESKDSFQMLVVPNIIIHYHSPDDNLKDSFQILVAPNIIIQYHSPDDTLNIHDPETPKTYIII